MAELKFAQKIAIDFGTKPVKKRRTAEERKAAYERTKERVCRAIEKDGGRYVTFPECPENENATGLLVCALEFEKKLYFLFIDKDRQARIIYHGESYKLIRDVPASLSVLNYMYMNQRSELKTAIEYFFEENEQYKLISDIAIYPKKRSFDGRRKDSRKEEQQSAND